MSFTKKVGGYSVYVFLAINLNPPLSVNNISGLIIGLPDLLPLNPPIMQPPPEFNPGYATTYISVNSFLRVDVFLIGFGIEKISDSPSFIPYLQYYHSVFVF